MEGYTEVFCWGGDHFGQLGLGQNKAGKAYSVPRFCSFNIVIRKVSCGEEHTGFISESGHIYTMGNNSEGRLGLNDRSLYQSSSPCLVEALLPYNAVDISCGWAHTLVATDAGLVFSWGLGEFGALGTGSTDSQWLPLRVRLPNACRALQVSAGARHSGVLCEDGYQHGLVLTCGSGEAGQLGTGRRERELHFAALTSLEPMKQVECGIFHTLFLSKSGRVYATGGNSFGQLGIDSKKSCSVPARVSGLDGVFVEKVACGNHSAALSDKGELFLWGSGVFGEFLRPERVKTDRPMIDVSVGGCFGLSLDVNHNLCSWGANSNGELGHGDYETRASMTQVLALQGKQVTKLACGGNFSVCLGNDVASKIPFNARPYEAQQAYRHSLRPELSRTEYPEYSQYSRPEPLRQEYSRQEYSRTDLSPQQFREPSRTDMSKHENWHQEQPERFRREPIRPDYSRISDLSRISDEASRVYRAEPSAQPREPSFFHENRAENENLTALLRRSQEDYEFLERRYQEQSLKVKELHEQLSKEISARQSYLQEASTMEKNVFDREHQHKSECDQLYTTISQLEENCRKEARANEELTKLLHEERMKNDRVSSQYSHTNKEVAEYGRQIENMKLSNQDLEHQFRQVSAELHSTKDSLGLVTAEKDKLYQENLALADTNRRLTRKVEDVQYTSQMELSNKLQEFESHSAQLQEQANQQLVQAEDKCLRLEDELARSKRELDAAVEDRRVLEQSLSSNQVQADHTRGQLDQTVFERDSLQRQVRDLQEQLATTHADFNNLTTQLESEKAHSLNLQSQAHFANNDTAKLQEELARAQQDNNHLRSNLDELTYQVERLSRDNNDHLAQIQRMQEANREFNEKYDQLQQENRQLHDDIAELENKNRQLFDNLQKELAQRAKEYKERTMSMLSTPMRAGQSPCPPRSSLTPATPPPKITVSSSLSRPPGDVDRHRTPDRHDTASGLLQVLQQHSPRYLASPSRAYY